MLTAMQRRAGEQSGFTLVELLVSMTLGLLVLGSTMFVMDRAFHHNSDITQRSDSQQRARLAMDYVVQTLRAQVCLDQTTTPVASGDANSVTFYADLSDGSKIVEKRTIAYDPAKGTLLESRYAGSTATPPTFGAQPTTKRMILRKMTQDGTTPVFTYYGYATVNPALPDQNLGTTLTAATAARVARIDVAFRAYPEGLTVKRANYATVKDRVTVRLADPNSSGTPTCT